MAVIDDILSGAGEFALGKEGSVDTQTLATLTPEQQEALKRALTTGPVQTGAIEGQTGEAGLALDDVAALRAEIASGQAGQTFGAVAERATDPEARKSFFESQLKPLEETAQESLQTVGRQFSGAGGFFGSERQAQDVKIQEAFAGAQANLLQNLIREDEDRALTAATGLAGQESQQLQALNIQLQGALASGNMEQVAQIQQAQQELQAQQLFQQLLGVKGFENVVTAQQGTQGQLGTVLGAAAGALI